MSAFVKIIGENDGSDEYAAAERLKKIIVDIYSIDIDRKNGQSC